MAKYDSPGFAGAFPTGDPIDAGSLSNAQGSTGGMRPASDDLGTQTVSGGYDPNLSADVPQGSLSTSADANPMRDTISGQDQSPRWSGGRPVGPPHPNAGR